VNGVALAVLGPVCVEHDGGRHEPNGARESVLLSALLVFRNQVIPADRLTSWMWPEESRSANALQAHVSRIRRLLGTQRDRLQYRPGGYLLRVEHGEVDDETFADALAHGRGLLTSGQPDAARALLTEALRLWRGEPYGRCGTLPFALTARERLMEHHLVVRELLAQATLGAGDPDEAAVLARELVNQAPTRPAGWATLVRALDASGRRADALATYSRARRLLVDATGLEPPTELQAAQWQILREERSAVTAAVAGPEVLEPVEMLRWLARQGQTQAAMQLAIRCAWGWWQVGERGRGRQLINDLLTRTPADGQTRRLHLRARVWAGALGTHERGEAASLRDAQEVLASFVDEWDRSDALAAVLVADRRAERGELTDAAALLTPALALLRAAGEEWGTVLADLGRARVDLMAGAVESAEQAAATSLRTLAGIGDPAGQLAALTLLGYTSEIRGAYPEAMAHHRRALVHAVHGRWAYAQCWHTVRLGNLLVLAGQQDAGQVRLAEGLALARSTGSPSLAAFARLGLGIAGLRQPDLSPVAEHLRHALAWYQEAGSLSGVALSAAVLARTRQTRPAEQGTMLRIAAEAACSSRDHRGVAYVLETAAVLADDPVTVARFAGAAAALRARVGRPLPEAEQPDLRRALGSARRRLTHRFDAATWAGARTVDELEVSDVSALLRILTPEAAGN
jgi:DNA-binding transcriptional activator of the SARP family